MIAVKSAPDSRCDQPLPLGLALLHALKAHGAREIFGIPGDFIVPFFRQIEDAGILPLYALSHEPSLGFAADAAARVNCGLGVVAVTYGAGALNLVNAVAGATRQLATLAGITDRYVVDGAVTTTAALAQDFGAAVRTPQTGRIRVYVTALVFVSVLAVAVTVFVMMF